MKRKVYSARELFRMRFPGGDKNFITPNVLSYKKVNPNVAVELSTGRSILRRADSRLYGVTVVAKGKKAVRSLHSKSKAFASRNEAEAYINKLKRKMKKHRRR